ncbi:hypothetical protein AMECASPLE_030404 [Ameca splendens]|uniref:Uncharacterized protein n=1 Tax=Ameca splendens TaxID=208324 RepID=A0ABV0Z533_9TELE
MLQIQRWQRTGNQVEQPPQVKHHRFFQKEARGKRCFAPYRREELRKTFLVNFFLLEKQYEKTPKGEEELPLTCWPWKTFDFRFACDAYPRLANICGGWMLHKSTGGGGQRNLVVIPPDLHGYTGQQLKVVSGNGKHTLYISPLQEELDTNPLPLEAKDFEKRPKA